MTDIYDIKILLFSFLSSLDYVVVIFIIVFLLFFYFLLEYFFFPQSPGIKLQTEHISDEKIKQRLEYLANNAHTFSRDIFYREVGLFLRMLISKQKEDWRVFFMTLSEIEKNFKSYYFPLLKEVYYLEFNHNLEDNFEVRKKILEKIKV